MEKNPERRGMHPVWRNLALAKRSSPIDIDSPTDSPAGRILHPEAGIRSLKR